MSTPLQTDRFPELAYTLARLQCVCERVFAADEERLRLFVHLRVGAFISRQEPGFNGESLLAHLPAPGDGTTDSVLHDWTARLLAVSSPDRTCTLQHNPQAVIPVSAAQHAVSLPRSR